MISPETTPSDVAWPGVTKDAVEKMVRDGSEGLLSEMLVYGRMPKEKQRIVLDALLNSNMQEKTAKFILENKNDLVEEDRRKLAEKTGNA